VDGCSFTSRPVKREIMYPSMDAGNLFKISINKIDLGLDNIKKIYTSATKTNNNKKWLNEFDIWK